MSIAWWVWVAVLVAIAAMLAVDLFLHRDNHVIGFREAAVWSGLWIGAGLGFGLLLWWWQGSDVAGTYYAGYLIEKALSIDNVFVFALVFSAFAVPAAVQHRVLFWGVVGALVFRFVFIFVGAELLETFFWTAYVFGAFLIYTGYKMAFRHGEQSAPEHNPVVRLVRRVIPTDPAYHGEKFFTRVDGKRVATLLFVVLVAIEATDLIFAIDSVAAVLAITTSFAGVKLVLSETPVGKLPIPLTLSVIVVTIAVSIGWSLISTRGAGPAADGSAADADGSPAPARRT